MAAFVYVIGTGAGATAKTYVGWTVDPSARVDAHNSGRGAKSTRGRRWTLLYLEKHPSRGAAMSREWQIKRDRPLRRRLRGVLSD